MCIGRPLVGVKRSEHFVETLLVAFDSADEGHLVELNAIECIPVALKSIQSLGLSGTGSAVLTVIGHCRCGKRDAYERGSD
jgi:hypothetical protein